MDTRQQIDQLRSRGLDDESIQALLGSQLGQETIQEQFGSATEAFTTGVGSQIHQFGESALQGLKETVVGKEGDEDIHAYDVVAGLPDASRKVGSGLKKFGEAVVQAPGRGLEFFAGTFAEAGTGDIQGGLVSDEERQSGAAKTFFGEERTKTAGEFGAGARSTLESTGIELTKAESVFLPMVIAGATFFGAATDLFGFGGVKNSTLNSIKKSNDANFISNILSSEFKGLESDVVDSMARQLAKIDNDKGVQAVIARNLHGEAVKRTADVVSSRGTLSKTAAAQKADDILGKGGAVKPDGTVSIFLKGVKEDLAQARKTGDFSNVEVSLAKAKATDDLKVSKVQVPLEYVNPKLAGKVDVSPSYKNVPTKAPVKRAIDESVGVTKTVDDAQEMLNLRAQVSNLQAMGSKSTTKKAQAIQATQEALVNSLKGIPVKERGKFVNAIKGTTTTKGLTKALERVEKIKEGVQKTEAKRKAMVEARRQTYKTLKEKGVRDSSGILALHNLPPVKKMGSKELKKFNEVLSKINKDDELLTGTMIKRIQRQNLTNLEGVLTKKEAIEAVAAATGVDPSELQKLDINWTYDLMHDSILAQQNPLMNLLVSQHQQAKILSNSKSVVFERELDGLIKSARKSRKETFGEKVAQFIAPTDEQIFKYMDGDTSIELTKQEMKVVDFLKETFGDVQKKLVAQGVMKKGRENYITHIQKGFSETVATNMKDSSILGFPKAFWSGVRSMYKQAQESYIPISPIGNTGDVLSPEKFFRFSLQRSKDGIDPTNNVAKAAKVYMRSFYKKEELDKFLPEMLILVDSLSSVAKTSDGKQLGDRLLKFTRSYLNTKKGKDITFGTPLGKNGAIGQTTLALKSFTTLKDLGLNVALMSAAIVGEATATLVSAGILKSLKGATLAYTPVVSKKYRKIINDNSGYFEKGQFWEDVLSGMYEPDKVLSERATAGLFSLYTFGRRVNDEVFFLSQLTKDELKSGAVSPERLASMRVDMGRYRNINEPSLVGATPLGQAAVQYKTFAVPWMTQVSHNLRFLTRHLWKRDFSVLGEKETLELIRLSLISASFIYMFSGNDEKGETFSENLAYYAKRDALSGLQAIDPAVWLGVPRVGDFIQDLGVQVVAPMLNYLRLLVAGDSSETQDSLQDFKDGAYKNFIPNQIQSILDADDDLGSYDFDDLDLSSIDFGGPDFDLDSIDFSGGGSSGDIDFNNITF